MRFSAVSTFGGFSLLIILRGIVVARRHAAHKTDVALACRLWQRFFPVGFSSSAHIYAGLSLGRHGSDYIGRFWLGLCPFFVIEISVFFKYWSGAMARL